VEICTGKNNRCPETTDVNKAGDFIKAIYPIDEDKVSIERIGVVTCNNPIDDACRDSVAEVACGGEPDADCINQYTHGNYVVGVVNGNTYLDSYCNKKKCEGPLGYREDVNGLSIIFAKTNRKQDHLFVLDTVLAHEIGHAKPFKLDDEYDGENVTWRKCFKKTDISEADCENSGDNYGWLTDKDGNKACYFQDEWIHCYNKEPNYCLLPKSEGLCGTKESIYNKVKAPITGAPETTGSNILRDSTKDFSELTYNVWISQIFSENENWQCMANEIISPTELKTRDCDNWKSEYRYKIYAESNIDPNEPPSDDFTVTGNYVLYSYGAFNLNYSSKPVPIYWIYDKPYYGFMSGTPIKEAKRVWATRDEYERLFDAWVLGIDID
jgi:hypothetical protein